MSEVLAGLGTANDALAKNGDQWDDLARRTRDAATAAAEAIQLQAEGLQRGVSSIASALSGIGQLIAQTGEENFAASKAFAVAGAVVSGISGVAAAVADGWKFGPIVAGLQGAAAGVAAATNIASLMSTSSSSTSMPGSAGSVPSVAAPQMASPDRAVHLTLNGSNFSSQQVEELMRQMLDAQGDGYKLVLS